MKKLALLAAAVLGLAASAPAQVALVEDWKITGGDFTWFPASGDTVRGMDISGSTLLVASRSDGNLVRLVNATTGAPAGNLDGSAFVGAGATHVISRVGVAGDGVAYVCNLATASGIFRVYRFADINPSTVATEAINLNPPPQRLGDTMAVRGSGTGTVIYVGGGSTTGLAKLTTVDGLTFTHTIVTPAGIVGTPHITYDKVANDGSYWFRATNGTGGSYSNADVRVDTLVPRAASTLYGPIDVNNFNGVPSIALGTGNVGAGNTIIQGEIWALATLNTATVPDYVTDSVRPAGGTFANGNGAGVAILAGSSVYFLATNNTISKSSLAGSVSDWNLID